MAGKNVSTKEWWLNLVLTWWLKSRCVVATDELFSFIDVLMLEVRWRGRNLPFYRQYRCETLSVEIEILSIQAPSKACVA